jgi:hypothetical protein
MASTRLTRTSKVQEIDKNGHGVLGLKEASTGSSTSSLFGVLIVHAYHDNLGLIFKMDAFSVRFYNGTMLMHIITTNRLFRDTSAWYHMVIIDNTSKCYFRR